MVWCILLWCLEEESFCYGVFRGYEKRGEDEGRKTREKSRGR